MGSVNLEPRLRAAVRDDILFLHLADTAKARRLSAAGRCEPTSGGTIAGVNTQRTLLERGGRWRSEE